MIIQGIYDGVKIIPTQQVPMKTNTRVEIIFKEEIEENKEEAFQNYFRNSIFDFWGNEREEREVNDLNEK